MAAQLSTCTGSFITWCSLSLCCVRCPTRLQTGLSATPRRSESTMTSYALPAVTQRASSGSRGTIFGAAVSPIVGTASACALCTRRPTFRTRSTRALSTTISRVGGRPSRRFPPTVSAGRRGRCTRSRGFSFPGARGGASAYLAQHDFVHVIADFGTTLEGELEVFTLVGRADPDPRGFAWLATVVGLFETGYVHQQGFFQVDVRDRHLQTSGMTDRMADALARGKEIAERFGTDLLSVDFHTIADRPLDEVRAMLHVPAKGAAAVAAGSPGVHDLDGMSASQRAIHEPSDEPQL